ncbi:MAG: hypothetical protein U5K54_16460 [Cytophagales bacterium]|nr:hypothetical protein [Cytophagales bacterium]
MISKRFIKITFPIFVLVAIYFLGPAPQRPIYDLTPVVVPSSAEELESYVAANEAQHKIKPDNEARIIWNDSTKQKTEYAVVYLHGFSGQSD